MKYSSKYKFIPILLILSSIIASRWQRGYPPWDPTRNFFELPHAILYFLLFLYFLYDRIQMKRYYEQEGTHIEQTIRNKHMLTHLFLLVLLMWLSISSLFTYFGYEFSLLSIFSGSLWKP